MREIYLLDESSTAQFISFQIAVKFTKEGAALITVEKKDNEEVIVSMRNQDLV